MRWLVIALVLAAGIIGVETYVLLEKPLPPPPLKATIILPPAPPPALPHEVMKRKATRTTAKVIAKETQRPFAMPTGGIFSGADPQDPRIYHFNAE